MRGIIQNAIGSGNPFVHNRISAPSGSPERDNRTPEAPLNVLPREIVALIEPSQEHDFGRWLLDRPSTAFLASYTQDLGRAVECRSSTTIAMQAVEAAISPLGLRPRGNYGRLYDFAVAATDKLAVPELRDSAFAYLCGVSDLRVEDRMREGCPKAKKLADVLIEFSLRSVRGLDEQ